MRTLVLVASSLIIACGSTSSDSRKTGGAGGTGSGDDAGGTIPDVACVDVSHVGALQRDDLHVIGMGFDADEGRMIRVTATIGDPDYGIGEAPITGGAFDMTLPGVLADYTELGVYVDRVRDDRCDPDSETLWQQATGPLSSIGPTYPRTASGEVLWKITPDQLHTFESAGPCVINGNFDLKIARRCSTTR
jgi:hypothetical protein